MRRRPPPCISQRGGTRQRHLALRSDVVAEEPSDGGRRQFITHGRQTERAGRCDMNGGQTLYRQRS